MRSRAMRPAPEWETLSMAGADDRRPRMTADEMRTIVRHAGLRAVERDTLYNEL